MGFELSRFGASSLLDICSVGELTRSGGWRAEAWGGQTLLGFAGTFAFSAMLHL